MLRLINFESVTYRSDLQPLTLKVKTHDRMCSNLCELQYIVITNLFEKYFRQIKDIEHFKQPQLVNYHHH